MEENKKRIAKIRKSRVEPRIRERKKSSLILNYDVIVIQNYGLEPATLQGSWLLNQWTKKFPQICSKLSEPAFSYFHIFILLSAAWDNMSFCWHNLYYIFLILFVACTKLIPNLDK